MKRDVSLKLRAESSKVNRQQVQGQTIYTIGHSNQEVKTFIGLLKKYSIEVVVDVRSNPYSKYASQFNKKEIQRDIQTNDMNYLFLGKEIGGKPSDPQFYDSDGYVLYSKIAGSADFLEGIERLLNGIKQYKIALMCSEENPETCHRRLLIGKVLSDHGVEVLHIRSDGRVQSERDILREDSSNQKNEAQQSLFMIENGNNWKSVRAVKKAETIEAEGV